MSKQIDHPGLSNSDGAADDQEQRNETKHFAPENDTSRLENESAERAEATREFDPSPPLPH
jgi:hypothetical protein